MSSWGKRFLLSRPEARDTNQHEWQLTENQTLDNERNETRKIQLTLGARPGFLNLEFRHLGLLD